MIATFDQILGSISKKKTASVYLLAGEEPFYIDKLTRVFESSLIPEEGRDFNLTVKWAQNEALHKELISDVMRFPIMSERQLVIVHEAQQMTDIDKLAPYLKDIPPTTTLVLAYKKKLDKRLSWYKTLEKVGVVFESVQIPDYRLPDIIASIVSGKSLFIDPRSASILADYLGNDIAKIEGEIDKLKIALDDQQSKNITPELIELHIGISKEYNNFELLRAVQQRDYLKAHRIARQFSKNERAHPIQPTLAILFNYFSSLMVLCYLPQKSEQHIMSTLGIQRFRVRDFSAGLRNYNSRQVFEIIRFLRQADAKSKGVDVGSPLPNVEILTEVLSKIFYA